jgi:ribonuclease BN (tRNA processing enzyme)
MTMHLIALGGSAAWPNPGQGCSSYLARSGDTSVLLDCGPNTLLELRRHIDFTTIDAVVISHCHADHILDLVPFRYGLTYGPVRASRRIPIWLPPGGSERLDRLGDAFEGQNETHLTFWNDVFDMREYDPGQTLAVGDLTISFAPTQHFIECYATRVESSDGASIVYASDTGSAAPILNLARGAGLLIAEATLRDHGDTSESERGHLTPEDAGQFAADSGVGMLLLTHLWSERPEAEVVNAAASRFGGDIFVSRPGLRLDIDV